MNNLKAEFILACFWGFFKYASLFAKLIFRLQFLRLPVKLC